jgi:glutaminyl-peptide cyclotransferase
MFNKDRWLSNKKYLVLALGGFALIFIMFAIRYLEPATNKHKFNGQRALGDVEYQVNLGPRIPDSQAHRQTVDWLLSELRGNGWNTEVQEAQVLGHPVRNVVARWGEGRPWVILGAHYDSRLQADRDPTAENRVLPVPGANDGASGVAVLTELSRTLPALLEASNAAGQTKFKQVWLVFFDAEDNGKIEGWDWILGSRIFVSGLTDNPDAVVIVDMIGDADLNIYMERNSDPELTKEIWGRAKELGYHNIFIPQYKYRILDDHLPFIEAGIPAVDLIDFDYAYWHTREDTSDKVSAQSLQSVGDTILSWLMQ